MNLLKLLLFILGTSSCILAQNINGWTNMSGAMIYVDNGLAIEKNGTGPMGASKQASATLEAGYQYHFSAIVDKGSCNSASSIEAKIVNSSGQIVVSEIFSTPGQSNLFTQFTVPVDGTYFMQFERVGNNTNCTFYINKIKLEKVEVVTEVCTVPVGEYRYGFQGQERDDKVKGTGNSINYTYRMYDPRLGKFFTTDPLLAAFPWNSPYTFSENQVIHMV